MCVALKDQALVIELNATRIIMDQIIENDASSWCKMPANAPIAPGFLAERQPMSQLSAP